MMRAGLILGMLAALGAAQDETRRVGTDDGKYGLELPASWKTRPLATKRAVLGIGADLPGNAGRVRVYVHRVQGMHCARTQPYIDRATTVKRENAERAMIALDPLPHMWMNGSMPGSHEYVYAIGYRILGRVGYGVEFEVSPRKAWPQVRAAFFEACRSLRVPAGEWPPPPKGFRRVVKDGYVYFMQPGVKAASVGRMHRLVKKVAKDLTPRYGVADRTDGASAQIVVYRSKADLKRATPKGFYFDWTHARLHARQVLSGDRNAEVYFSEVAVTMVLCRLFGRHFPNWIYYGEGLAMRTAVQTGKKLPRVDPGTRAALPDRLKAFGSVTSLDSKDDSFQAFVYYAFFLAGPAMYRKAFRAYVSAAAKSGDWERARAEHLLPLDQRKLYEDATAFLRGGFRTAR